MSKEILKSELDIFKNINYQASIENSTLVPFRPMSAVMPDSSTIEFVIPGNSDEYVDLKDVFLWLKLSIVDENGNSFTATQDGRYSLINYGLNCIWDQIDVYLNNTLISQSTNTYPYRAYIETLIGTGELSKLTYLKAAGFSTPTSKIVDFDSIDSDLSSMAKQSKVFSLYGRIHGDIFNSERLLLNGVTLRLVLTKAKDRFSLMGSSAQLADATKTPAITALDATKPKLLIKDASLFVRKVKVNPSILVAHAQVLKNSKCIYPIEKIEVKTITLSANQSTFILDNIYIGPLPSKLIVGLCEHDSQLGDFLKNPLAFKNYGLNYLCCHLNNIMYPSKPYEPNYDDDLYAREYFDFYSNIGQAITEPNFKTSFPNYKNGYNLYSFNFNPDQQITSVEDYVNLTKEGFLRLELHFKTALVNPLKVICYGSFQNSIEIDSNRIVTTDY